MKATEAQKRANKKWYAKAKESVLERIRKYSKTPVGKAVQAKKDKNSQKKHSQHWYARSAVWRAVRTGRLERNSFCAVANCRIEDSIQAHHYLGYEKEHWLDVIWVCPKHHRKLESNIYSNPDLLQK